MKWNWGTGIALFYSTFVLVMIFMVIQSSRNSVELVREDYYDSDLNYESFRQKRQNSALLSRQVTFDYQEAEKLLAIAFPDELRNVEGALTFFRPSNRFQDVVIKLKLDEANIMQVPVHALRSGLWRIQVDWESGGKSYYKEESIVL